MSGKRLIQKRCQRCRWQGTTGPRMRRCHNIEVRFGRRYLCWGQLQRVELVKRQKPKEVAVAERSEQEAAREFRETAQGRVRWAQRRVSTAVRKLARLTATLQDAQRDVDRYGKEAALSDAEILALQEKRSAAARKAHESMKRPARRGMALG